MSNNKIIIDESLNIKEAIERLDEGGKKVLFIESDGKLKAVLTDGDIRRWILKNGNLDESVERIANYNPKYLFENEKFKAKDIMREYSINSIPILNINKEIKSIIFWDDIEFKEKKIIEKLNLPVVIMAGGLGTRLYPYTKILPKPLIPIGDTPIIERIINKFNYYGCNEYYLTVNYKKNMIKSYFGDIEKSYEISYIDEDKPLGTGGSLYYLKGKIDKTFFVSNCDILIDADYVDIYNYHKSSRNVITMVCAMKNVTIPYGVIELDSYGKINNMIEKPKYSFLTNTGVYIIEPSVLDLINENEFIHLPEIVQKCIDKYLKVGVYPVTERAWMDMGQPEEMQEMIDKLCN